MEPRAGPPEPTAEAVRTALDRLLASPQFAPSPRASRLIRFIVQAALAGRKEIKEYVLGIEVFDRGPGFDPGTDTIVRVEAVKLRKRLEAYYRASGRHDPLVISVPKGAYLPQFRVKADRGSLETRRARASRSIAVLPFLNLSANDEDEWWSDGVADELISLLSRTSGLRVVSRTSAFAFKAKPWTSASSASRWAPRSWSREASAAETIGSVLLRT